MCFVEVLTALGRSCASDTAGIDNDKVRPFGSIDVCKTEFFEQLPNLLTFVLIDFAANGVYRKCFHNML